MTDMTDMTDMTKLIVALRNLTKNLKIKKKLILISDKNECSTLFKKCVLFN